MLEPDKNASATKVFSNVSRACLSTAPNYSPVSFADSPSRGGLSLERYVSS